ncbi:5-methyltetrahydropteroyltriglutamate--homocysteine S-methyltransferase [Verticiella sediminum]|uniref:5-methyltetrahydropteroyltriglutamate--homocysteine S-methyltransferase n=1 Tax=Verticiella sediminum TaxID=1247510 RepID=A0A556A921_9BURK|nr:5-methyltetrahydropteroyltriglutamate--homocysteine S-methyltransferase [Verticiella sediminum]TSH89383.1 5-methyltetrahydropteroyltriglutamate--homocysteine S-methyltransferase [Verticiella sediminum]
MTLLHNLGFPRLGARRELKTALEAYWAGETTVQALQATGRALRARHWQLQREAGLDRVPVGDFAWYDQVLEWSATVGAVPARFGADAAAPVTLDTLFRMARGRAPTGAPAAACASRAWFATNYHYVVPELQPGLRFRLAYEGLFDQVAEALALGHAVKPVIPGPLSWLWLGAGEAYGAADDSAKLALLPTLLPVYATVLARLAALGVDWVQLDEPILALALPSVWRDAFRGVYGQLLDAPVKLLLAAGPGSLGDNLALACALPVAGLHIDAVQAPGQLEAAHAAWPPDRVLSAGCVDGANVWRTDLAPVLERLRPLARARGERLWLAPSCSLLHLPMDLAQEDALDAELKRWLAFARQRLEELAVLGRGLAGQDVHAALAAARAAVESRRTSARVHRASLPGGTHAEPAHPRPPRAQRLHAQQARLPLPPAPATAVGAFPQSGALRRARRDWKAGELTDTAYGRIVRAEIERAVRGQEDAGLDVLAHGEAERNDMVEYFGELLAGFAFTRNGWVQSRGSHCVKPPILFGDVVRAAPMTVGWTRYAQSLTARPVKGALTGPLTLLQRAFVRDDLPRAQLCRQLALALRDEVRDLAQAGIAVIQLEEPGLYQGLPWQREARAAYLASAVDAFRIVACGADSATRIHLHLGAAHAQALAATLVAMDPDVLTVDEPAGTTPCEDRPDAGAQAVRAAAARLVAERRWEAPPGGLKTLAWTDVPAALQDAVRAAAARREGGVPASQAVA